MAELSYCGGLIRKGDPDRFFTGLFAPPERREALFAVYAMNLELARIADQVSEPMLGEIRLQWWRESLEGIDAGTPRRHEVVLALAEVMGTGRLSRSLLDAAIDARARDLDPAPPADLAELVGYAEATGGTFAELALEALVEAPDSKMLGAARSVGRAHALVGLMRSMPHNARRQRLHLPADLMASAGVTPRQLYDLKLPAGLPAAVEPVLAAAEVALAEARASCPAPVRPALAVFLTGQLTAGDLKALKRAGHDPFSRRSERSRLARQLGVLWAVIRGGY